MNDDDRRKKRAELEAELEEMEHSQRRKRREHERDLAAELADPRVRRGIEARAHDHLDEHLSTEIAAADAIADEIMRLAEELAKLDLIGPDDPWKPRPETAQIEADHPSGPRLYGFQGADTILATRQRDDGRYEHAVLDEFGLPIEWRTAIRPGTN